MKHYWYINNGDLKFIGEDGVDVALSPITVRYRKRFSNEIKTAEEVDALTVVPDGTIDIKMGDNAVFAAITGDLEYGQHFRLTERLQVSHPPFPTSTRKIYYITDESLCVGSQTANGMIFSTLVDIADMPEGISLKYTLTTHPWEDQDDGLDSDVQLAALYLAVSRAADLAGGDPKTSSYFYSKYNNMQKELKRKYNSAKYKNITIRPNQF